MYKTIASRSNGQENTWNQIKRLPVVLWLNNFDNNIELNFQTLPVSTQFRSDYANIDYGKRSCGIFIFQHYQKAWIILLHLWCTITYLYFQGKSPSLSLHFNNIVHDVLLMLHENAD